MQLITCFKDWVLKKVILAALPWLTALLFIFSQPAEAVTIISKISGGKVTTSFERKEKFRFTAEGNENYVREILGKLPLAQSVTLVSSSEALESGKQSAENKVGYSQRNLKRVHMAAVSFVRSDILPMMYFQVKEDWKDCAEGEKSCFESVTLEVAGPSRLVRNLNDFGAFPKALNVMNAKIVLDNPRKFSYIGPFADDSDLDMESDTSTVSWTMNIPDAATGVEDFMRYFRAKALKDQHKVTLQNVRGAMALWANDVTKKVFN